MSRRIAVALLGASTLPAYVGLMTADVRAGLVSLACVGAAWLARDFGRDREMA